MKHEGEVVLKTGHNTLLRSVERPRHRAVTKAHVLGDVEDEYCQSEDDATWK